MVSLLDHGLVLTVTQLVLGLEDQLEEGGVLAALSFQLAHDFLETVGNHSFIDGGQLLHSIIPNTLKIFFFHFGDVILVIMVQFPVEHLTELGNDGGILSGLEMGLEETPLIKPHTLEEVEVVAIDGLPGVSEIEVVVLELVAEHSNLEFREVEGFLEVLDLFVED